jgi:F0F1-type ATP synthase membrane subunit a
MHVSLTAEKIFDLGPLPVTNSLLTTWVVVGLVAIFAIIFKLRLKKNPTGTQNVIELIIGKTPELACATDIANILLCVLSVAKVCV